MISLKHQIICLIDTIFYFIGNMANIGDDAKTNSLTLNEVSHIVGAVVWNIERKDIKIS